MHTLTTAPNSKPLSPPHPQAEELQRLGLDPSKAYRLDTAETAEALYKKKEKKPAPTGM